MEIVLEHRQLNSNIQLHKSSFVLNLNGLACVHCGSMSVKRNGTYKARQRYLCKDCRKSFNDMTGSPLSGTKYPHKWLKYIEMMIDGCSLRTIAKELKIYLSTAFYWRHKVLFGLQSLGHQKRYH